jgi:hypothetical protein
MPNPASDACNPSNIKKLKGKKKKDIAERMASLKQKHLVWDLNAYSVFFFFFWPIYLCCSKSGHHQPQKGLAKFGYKTNKEVKKSRTLLPTR